MWWVAGSGLLGALAAMLETTSGNLSEIAAVLAVGALAMLAGHRWGLLIVVIADVMLIGRMWPIVAFPDHQTTASVAIAIVALLSTLPGVVLLGRTMPKTVEVLLGRHSHLHSTGVVCCSIFLAVWVVIPAFPSLGCAYELGRLPDQSGIGNRRRRSSVVTTPST